MGALHNPKSGFSLGSFWGYLLTGVALRVQNPVEVGPRGPRLGQYDQKMGPILGLS
jgi:hypothetical protein